MSFWSSRLSNEVAANAEGLNCCPTFVDYIHYINTCTSIVNTDLRYWD